jgi:hypothetical protein
VLASFPDVVYDASRVGAKSDSRKNPTEAAEIPDGRACSRISVILAAIGSVLDVIERVSNQSQICKTYE